MAIASKVRLETDRSATATPWEPNETQYRRNAWKGTERAPHEYQEAQQNQRGGHVNLAKLTEPEVDKGFAKQRPQRGKLNPNENTTKLDLVEAEIKKVTWNPCLHPDVF